jgi:TPR repeat protein
MRTVSAGVMALILAASGCSWQASEPRTPSPAPGCSADIPRDCANFAARARTNHYAGVSTNELRALLEDGCNRGESDACVEHGLLLVDGPGAVRDLGKAVTEFRSLCQRDAPTACMNLLGALEAESREQPGVATHRRAEARLALVKSQAACEQGQLKACNNVAYAYESDLLGTPDHARALGLYRGACKKGLAVACSNVAILYRKGKGVEQSDAKAAEWNLMGCNGGDPKGCNNLGYAYESGRGVSVDLERAITFYEKGCTPAYGFGCLSLAHLYAKRGSADDSSRSRALLERACRAGVSHACAELGEIVATGH